MRSLGKLSTFQIGTRGGFQISCEPMVWSCFSISLQNNPLVPHRHGFLLSTLTRRCLLTRFEEFKCLIENSSSQWKREMLDLCLQKKGGVRELVCLQAKQGESQFSTNSSSALLSLAWWSAIVLPTEGWFGEARPDSSLCHLLKW